MSEDPLGFRGGINFYAYADIDPIDVLHPFGLAPQVLGPLLCFSCDEFAQGTWWMWEGYKRMRDMKWRNSDKYFHCMANCRATNAGSGGASAAKIISFIRTDVRSRWTEPTDWRNDKVANECGQQGGYCEKTCSQFFPISSPGNHPFPGWPKQ